MYQDIIRELMQNQSKPGLLETLAKNTLQTLSKPMFFKKNLA